MFAVLRRRFVGPPKDKGILCVVIFPEIEKKFLSGQFGTFREMCKALVFMSVLDAVANRSFLGPPWNQMYFVCPICPEILFFSRWLTGGFSVNW